MEVKVLNKNVERALKKLKRSLDREGIIKLVRNRRAYQKPSEKRYRKMRRAKYNNRMKSKQEQL